MFFDSGASIPPGVNWESLTIRESQEDTKGHIARAKDGEQRYESNSFNLSGEIHLSPGPLLRRITLLSHIRQCPKGEHTRSLG